MSRMLVLAAWTLTGSIALAADNIEPLDVDFLDYLADLESDDDNWTMLDDPDRKPAGEKPVPEQPKPADRKPSQEAAKPAVEKR